MGRVVTPSGFVVELIHHTPLSIVDTAIGKCWDKELEDEERKLKRIERVVNKNKHKSTFEHAHYTFDIDGIPRGVLQELARHRMQNLSVKSSRYTLKELKDTKPFVTDDGDIDWGRVFLFIVSAENLSTDIANVEALENLRKLVEEGVPNDKAKLAIPEAYRTSLVSTMDGRNLQNFLQLRTDKAAWKPIRELTNAMFEALPESHKFLFEEYVNHV